MEPVQICLNCNLSNFKFSVFRKKRFKLVASPLILFFFSSDFFLTNLLNLLPSLFLVQSLLSKAQLVRSGNADGDVIDF